MQCGPVFVSAVGESVVCCAGGIVFGSCLLIRRSMGVSIRRSSGSDWGGVVDLKVSVCCAGSAMVCCVGSVVVYCVGSVMVCSELSSCCCSWW